MDKNLSISNFKLAPKALLIALPVILILRFGDLFLPANAFTHRLWEALIVHEFGDVLPGPFYPDQNIEMNEQGDLAAYTPFAVPKKVIWQTDRYGFRKTESSETAYPVVFVGDSTTLGTGLTQPDTVYEKLEQKTGTEVYPYAPFYNMEAYLRDDRFKQMPPRTVIFSMMEWALPDLLESSAADVKKANPVLKSLPVKMTVLADRASKMSLMRFLNGRIRDTFKNAAGFKGVQVVEVSGKKVVFPAGKGAHPELSLELAPLIALKIKQYQNEIEWRGQTFLFVPVPNKETVYFQAIGRAQPVFYSALIQELKKLGVPAVDLYAEYARYRMDHPEELIYQTDDTHWNPRGVDIAAEKIQKVIDKE